MDDLFRTALRRVIDDGTPRPSSVNPHSPHSRFGQGGAGILEARSVLLNAGSPFAVGLRSEVRAASLFRSLGMAIWNLRGDDTLAGVAPYNPGASLFCDGHGMIRAPWGLRLVGRDWTSSPMWRALRELAADPHSLRCCVPVFLPSDIGVASRDVPCLLALDLSIHEDELRATAVLRAMNAYGVFPHDHCLLACICEAARAHLRVPSVSLTYYVDSLHVPATDVDAARRVLNEEPAAGTPPPLQFRDSEFRAAIDELRAFEPPLRAALERGDGEAVAAQVARVVDRGITWAVDAIVLLHDAWRAEGQPAAR